jgi:hypothetical protein
MMHLERSVSIAARLAFFGAETGDEIVRTLRNARANRNGIDDGIAPCLHDQMLQFPYLMDARLARTKVVTP